MFEAGSFSAGARLLNFGYKVRPGWRSCPGTQLTGPAGWRGDRPGLDGAAEHLLQEAAPLALRAGRAARQAAIVVSCGRAGLFSTRVVRRAPCLR